MEHEKRKWRSGWKERAKKAQKLSDEDLSIQVTKVKKDIENLSAEDKKDRDIIKCFAGGEMGDAFVMSRRYGMSFEKLSQQLLEVRKDEQRFLRLQKIAEDDLVFAGEKNRRFWEKWKAGN